MRIFTIGHSTRSSEEFLDVLAAYGALAALFAWRAFTVPVPYGFV